MKIDSLTLIRYFTLFYELGTQLQCSVIPVLALILMKDRVGCATSLFMGCLFIHISIDSRNVKCWLSFFSFAFKRHCVSLMSYILVLFWKPTVSCALLPFIQPLWKVTYPSFPITLIELSCLLYPFTLRCEKSVCRLGFLSFNIYFVICILCHISLL